MASLKRRIATSLLPDPVIECVDHHREFGDWRPVVWPKTFNEQLVHRKVFCRDRLLTLTADKLAVRDFVAERVGSEYLIPLLATADRADDLPWDGLPSAFVVKANHGSGMNLFVPDASELDRSAAISTVNGWLGLNFYEQAREWAYKDISRKAIVEPYLSGPPPDYKFFVFGGEVRMIQVDTDRFSSHRRVLFTPEWRRLKVSYVYPAADRLPSRPGSLEEMIRVAQELAAPFPFARIDLYEYGDRVLFGEITHYPEAGRGVFDPPAFDQALGRVWSEGLPIPDAFMDS